jgi:hypothetical protein
MGISKRMYAGKPTKGKIIKLLPIQDCFDCSHRFDSESTWFCAATEETNEEEIENGWVNKVLPNSGGRGIPKWCPLEDKR